MNLTLFKHFFEDTLRTYIDIYLNGDHSNVDALCYTTANINNMRQSHVNKESLLRLINITDRFDFTCSLVNYFRYFLRFLSAYIIVVFTIQRAIAIYFPLFQRSKLESGLFAWVTVILITSIGAVSNIWVPFLFKPRELFLDKTFSIKYCDVQKEFKSSYFIITISYIVITMLIPILIIFVCNFLIIFTLIRAKKQRQSMLNGGSIEIEIKSTKVEADKPTLIEETSLLNVNKPVQSAKNGSMKKSVKGKRTNTGDDSNKITKMLILMSFSYAILNLPYFISWCLFFYNIAFGRVGLIGSNYLFSALNICEIFYISNYGIHFFIYCASGKKFRSHLRDSIQCLKR
jgi:hypothetical protein